MASLSDIPQSLLNEPNKYSFINWLSKVPAEWNHKRRLVSLYRKHTDIQFQSADYKVLEATSIPPKKPNA